MLTIWFAAYKKHSATINHAASPRGYPICGLHPSFPRIRKRISLEGEVDCKSCLSLLTEYHQKTGFGSYALE